MELCLGRLDIPPSEFWNLTLKEYKAIFYGRFGKQKAEPSLTMADIKEMEDRYFGNDTR